MKRLLYTGIFLFAAVNVFSQVMQASMGHGSSPSRVIVFIKPTTAVNGTISTLQFSVAINASVTPAPVVNIVGTPAFGVTWNIDPSYVEGGFRIYDFTTATSPSVTIGAGVETQVMEIEFTGGPLSTNNVSLLTLPAGGLTTGNTLFFCSGSASSVEGQLYYPRAGTTVVNNNSYTGLLSSSATLGSVILPLEWLSFNVIRQGNDGILNWSVAHEDANHHYELQRSSNGTNFTTIAIVNRSTNGNTNYSYTDLAINNSGASILYYRIRQVDVNGHISYSDTRLLRLDVREGQASIFPNPVKDGFYISIPSINTGNTMVRLNLTGANGQLADSKEITVSQAANYYFDIKGKKLAAGNYNLEIIFGNKIVETKRLLIIQ